ncbi:RTA-like protein [Xylariales sp. PMI_506]|nr:RTA-like protein [Xylariales sp. PMI_506]
MSWKNQSDMNGFLIQICCLTIGPAFMAAGIYFCLQMIVNVFGAGNSRLRPQLYPRIFIPCDVLSLILQGAGGGLASVASQQGDFATLKIGDYIMIAGLAFQVFTILTFIALTIDFIIRTVQRRKTLGAVALDQDPILRRIRNSFMFKACLVALSVATIAILWRCTFRGAELSGGWTGSYHGEANFLLCLRGYDDLCGMPGLEYFPPQLVPEGDNGLSRK